jgi:tetratricopeptide (TPR) repeat protein
MNVATNDLPTLTNSQTSGNSPSVIQPWEDFPTLMRHASRARAVGELKRASTFYIRAIELNPNSAQAWVGRASTTSNLDEAIVAWGYALALEPNDESRSVLGASVSEKMKQSRAKDVASLIAVGRRLAEAGQWVFAYHLFHRATELDPSNENAWMWRAGVAHETSEAVLCLNRVLELNPQNARAKAGLAWAASTRTDAPIPPDILQQAETAFEEGQRALRAGDRAQAYEHFHHATELAPQNASAWFWCGSTAPGIDEALSCMEQVLVIDPEDEAAKDARWWLRVRSLRERLPAPASPRAIPSAIGPATERNPQRWNRIALLIAFVLIGSLIGSIVVLIWVAWYAGYFG